MLYIALINFGEKPSAMRMIRLVTRPQTIVLFRAMARSGCVEIGINWKIGPEDTMHVIVMLTKRPPIKISRKSNGSSGVPRDLLTPQPLRRCLDTSNGN